MSMQALPVMPQPPHSILRPGTFNTDSDATFAKLPEVVEKYNANIPLIEGAALSAQNALTASDAALAAANFEGNWAALAGPLAIPASVSHAGSVWMLLEPVADVTTQEPGVSAAWLNLSLPPKAGNAGKFLSTDGSGLSWAALSANSKEFAASGSIEANKAVVLLANGQVAQSAIAAGSVGAVGTFENAVTNYPVACYAAAAGKHVIFYVDAGNSNYLTAVVATVIGDAVTFGAPLVVHAEAVGAFPGCCYHPPSGTIVVTYSLSATAGIRARVVSISGSTLTVGAQQGLTGFNGENTQPCYDASVDRVLLAYRGIGADNYARGVVLSIAGDVIAVVSGPTIIQATGIDNYSVTAVHCAGISLNAVLYMYGNQGRIRSVTINPTTYAMTMGGEYALVNAPGYSCAIFGSRIAAWVPGINRLAVLHNAGPSGSYYLQHSLHSCSAEAWTRTHTAEIDASSYGTPSQGFQALAYDDASGVLCACYPDAGSSNFGKIRFSTAISATSVSFSAEIQIDTTTTEYMSASAGGRHFLLAFKDDGEDDYGKARVAIAPKTDKRSSFIGFAASAAADGEQVTVKTFGGVVPGQAGLTPATRYYLNWTDGCTLTTTANGPIVGYAMSATELLVTGSNAIA